MVFQCHKKCDSCQFSTIDSIMIFVGFPGVTLKLLFVVNATGNEFIRLHINIQILGFSFPLVFHRKNRWPVRRIKRYYRQVVYTTKTNGLLKTRNRLQYRP